MSRKTKLMIIAVLLIGTLGVVAEVQKVKAVTRNFHLYGSAAAGWGFTPGTITSPGPTITVDQGDLINLTLTSQDGFPHQFYVDYNGNGVPDAGEPASPQFTGTINFQFTADTSGNFKYYCSIHPLVMFGDFNVAPPIPEFQPFLIVPLFMLATLLAVIVYRRKRSTQL